MTWTLRRRPPTPAPKYHRSVDEQRAAYHAQFGTYAGIDWNHLYTMERNRRGIR